MPSTLPGFLMLAGILMFVGSLFAKSVKFKDAELPALNNKDRKILRYCGIGLVVISASLYGAGIAGFVSIGKDLLMMIKPPVITASKNP